MKRELVLILDNVRSAHNVGSIFRSAEGLGVSEVWCCGITPYPKQLHDERLPHVQERATRQISKTALGAELTMTVQVFAHTKAAIEAARPKYAIWALEQATNSTRLDQADKTKDVALILGHERDGVDQSLLKLVDKVVEIPMIGQKESLNVSVAAAIACYELMRD